MNMRAVQPSAASGAVGDVVCVTEPPWLKAGTSVTVAPGSARTIDQPRHRLDRLVLALDEAISRQLDEILHHTRLQRLEASWRGLRYLIDTEAGYDETLSVKIKLLNVSWNELARDVGRALEFDQSHLFARIYSDEFDTPGGEPFGVLLGDYEISHRHFATGGIHSLDVLREIGRIATAALCPFIAAAGSELFGVDSFAELPQTVPLHQVFSQQEYLRWRLLRADEVTRFVGLALPRILMRSPYRDDGTRRDPIVYAENATLRPEHYLWGNACYAFGSVLIRAFANTGWFADIRGGRHPFGEGGLVRDLLHPNFDCDPSPAAIRTATELQIDDFGERDFSDLGFIPLCSYPGGDRSVFFSNSSLHNPAEHRSERADANERLSAMIQYMLCVSRFGHYVKVIGRDKVGSFVGPEECQRVLQNWLNQYTTSGDSSSAELRARYPLAASRVEVTELAGRPGTFSCTIWLQPHFQLDHLVSSIRLVTELAVGAIQTASL